MHFEGHAPLETEMTVPNWTGRLLTWAEENHVDVLAHHCNAPIWVFSWPSLYQQKPGELMLYQLCLHIVEEQPATACAGAFTQDRYPPEMGFWTTEVSVDAASVVGVADILKRAVDKIGPNCLLPTELLSDPTDKWL